MAENRLKFFGWGRDGEEMTPDEEGFALRAYAALFGSADFPAVPTPGLDAVALRQPRIAPPTALSALCSTERYDRAAHSFGKSYRDTVLGMTNDYGTAPDVVAYPRDEADVAAVMDWAATVGAALLPFGGGSSVVGGVTVEAAREQPLVALDLRELNKVVEVDRASRAARIQGGVFGPALEAQLKPHGLTLRHFPQSFEYSTLGGWIATRSGGHFASLYTHIDDLVQSIRVVTPAGAVETRRLPGSGAGPSPDRMFIGSEGVLGVITEAWMRLQDRP
ncbi:MAG TPA: FAD-binding oxidoreductase, partial [Acetobacteraceae bacterium]|nr:FAD-binding oxidoreductase [Acetobacteraceae bacterium]